MSTPTTRSTTSSNQDLVALAVLASEVKALKDRVDEDRSTNLRNRDADQLFNRQNFVSKMENKPMQVLFWAIVTSIILGVVGAGMTLLTHASK